jgi:TolB-like protein
VRYLFEEYLLDTGRRELWRGAEIVPVAPQVFDLLDYLISNRERVVGKEDLIKAVWRGRCVSDAALTTRMNAVRCAIGDNGVDQRLIRTLPRKGFRFIGSVVEANGLAAEPAGDSLAQRPVPAVPLPDGPSIVVLPFVNLSSEPDQDYFADGIVNEIITALSRFRQLFVIARNSSFIYKNRDIDVKQIGRDLGVRYILEGSVRKSASRVRIAVQLIDTAAGAHIWADRFDGALEDIFDLQDQLSARIVCAISPKLEQAEIARAKRKPTESLHAYDYYLRGLASFYHGSRRSTAEALELFKTAFQLDPGFASAYAMAAWCYAVPLSFWRAGRKEELEAERLARLGARLGPNDATALCIAGFVFAEISREFATGVALVDRALVLNPNLAVAWFLGGWVQVYNGEPELAIEYFARVERLSPFDPFIWAVHAGYANAHFVAGRDDRALAAAERCLRDMPNHPPALMVLAASSALIGAMDPARRAMAQILEFNPNWTISRFKYRAPCCRENVVARLLEGLRKAGMPE